MYYEIVPKIVSALNEKPDSRAACDIIYEKMVKPYVSYIEQVKMKRWRSSRGCTTEDKLNKIMSGINE